MKYFFNDIQYVLPQNFPKMSLSLKTREVANVYFGQIENILNIIKHGKIQ